MPGSQDDVPTGLATLALLKANYDSGRDHIDMFVPFIVDVLAARQTDFFLIADVQSDLVTEYGLDVPTSCLQILLSRVVRRGYARREAGSFYCIREALPVGRLGDRRRAVELEHMQLATELLRFGSTKGIHWRTNDEALRSLFAFLAKNHVGLLLERDDGAPINLSQSPSRHEGQVIADFISVISKNDQNLMGFLDRMLQGYVLRNALFLADISAARKRFRDLTVFLDTRVVLHALGLTSEAITRASREALDLIRGTGARLAVFDVTVEEIKRLLRVYVTNLRSSDGIRKLRQTELTRFFLTNKYRSSDVQQVIALLETDIRRLGMSIPPTPPRIAQYTLNEKDLAGRISEQERPDPFSARVQHDVDCVAAILTLRRGRHESTFESAKAVFSTLSGLLVKNVTEWYSEAGESGVQPILHHLALSNLAWLKNPSVHANLKLHELIAACSVVLKPSHELWESFRRHLRTLETSNVITSDETVAIIANSLTDDLLAELPADCDPAPETLTEIVERVKGSYAAEAQTRVEAAEARTAEHTDQRRQLELRVRSRADTLASLCASSLFWVVGLAVFVGLVFLLPGWFPVSGTWKLVAVAAILCVFLLTMANLLVGLHLKQARSVIQTRAQRVFRQWLMGDSDLDA